MTSFADQAASRMRSKTLKEVNDRVDSLIAKHEQELKNYEEERADYVSRSKGRREKEMVEARKDVSVLIIMTEGFLRDLRSLKTERNISP